MPTYHNCNKILKFDWLSTVLISAVIMGQRNGKHGADKAPCLRQQRHHARALEFFSFSTARNNRDFVIVMINW